MRSRPAHIPLFVRSLWIAVAVFMVVCCGPVKRLVELQLNKTTTQQTEDKKLKTSYRDKRSSAISIHFSDHHHAGDTDAFLLALLPLIVLFCALLRKDVRLYLLSVRAYFVRQVPLYLHYQNLRL